MKQSYHGSWFLQSIIAFQVTLLPDVVKENWMNMIKAKKLSSDNKQLTRYNLSNFSMSYLQYNIFSKVHFIQIKLKKPF